MRLHDLRLSLALLLSFGSLLSQAHAQASSSGDAEDSTPAANPARPTVTNPVHIPPPGYLQFEQGFVEATSSPDLRSQFNIVQTTKLSLNKHFMLNLGSQPFARSLSSDGIPAKDQGDLTLGGQVLLRDEKDQHHDHEPTFAIAYNRRIHTGSAPDLDIGSFAQGVVLLFSGNIPGFHYVSNLLLNEQTSSNAAGATVRRAQFGQTLTLTHQISKPFSVTGELWHFTQPLVYTTRSGAVSPRSNAVGLLGNVAWTVRPNLIFDAGAEHGLTSTSTDWQGFAGFTYLLPHRLWPTHHH